MSELPRDLTTARPAGQAPADQQATAKKDLPAEPGFRLKPEHVAKGLGWFSIALGVAELLAPKATAQAAGVRHGKNLLQAYGIREIATGIGLLTAKDPQPWLWARVGGDALDLATLATDLGAENKNRRNTVWSVAVLGVTALDVSVAESARRAAKAAAQPVHDYSDRVGMALSPDEMRGKARDAMQTATEYVVPSALRPYTLH